MQELYPSPSSEEVTKARLAARLTQAQAAHLVSSRAQAWTRWERDGSMPPGLWDLFLLLAPQNQRSEGDLSEVPKQQRPRERKKENHD